MFTQDATLSFRSGTVLPMDIVAGAVLVVVVLEAARRAVGNAICIVAVVMLIYCYVGPYLPAAIAHQYFAKKADDLYDKLAETCCELKTKK